MGASFAETIVGQTLELDLTKARTRKVENLATLCTDIFLIIIRMRESEDLGEPAALRKLIMHYLELFKNNCRAMNIDTAIVNDTIYALVALLDETVMSVPGQCRDFWITNPIQLQLFGANIAGEEFFRKLEKLMTDPRRTKDALEIYYLCLSLGFEGKYKLGNASEREEIIDKLARVLLKAGKRSVSGLSPHGRRRLSKALSRRSRKRLVPIWVVGAVTVILLIVLWVTLFNLTEQSVQSVIAVFQ
jgi:type VI secretion system protein ImpK